MITVSLKLPEALASALSADAKRRGTTKSGLIREALVAYLAGGNARKTSFASRAADLAGCIAGPSDLSSNPDHMAGYGR